MQVAALYDIHSNLPALEAVLEDVRQAGVDRVVVGGDVLPGPMPAETIERLLSLDIPVQFIQGNGDRVALAQMRGVDSPEVPAQYREIDRWVAQHLPPEYESLLASWPATLRMEIPALGEVLFCHATHRNDTEIFTRLTPEERLLPVFAGLNVAVVVCGHTHMQFDRMVGKTRVLNAGSVGTPYGEPGAYWLMLGSKVEFRHTSYDLHQADERMRATNYPHVEDFIKQNILQPPSQAEMLAIFSKAELK